MANIITRRANRNRNAMSSIFAVDPFGSLRDEFDHMLTNWFSDSEKSMLPQFSPSLDLNETDKSYEVHFDLPGINASEMRVQLSDNVLTVSGERKCEKPDAKPDGKKGGPTPHCVERFHGTFSRSIVLPGAVNSDKIDARYVDGVLTVTLPKADEVKPREITIRT